MTRLFVALNLPQEIKHGLQDLRIFMSGARWMEMNQLHLTLSFLGEIHERDFAEVSRNLSQISLPPFELTLKGVGAFKSHREARVLWAGVEKNKSLEQLQRKIENCLSPFIYQQEKRKFSPHITLARLRDTPFSKVGLFLQYFNLYRSTTFTVNEFHLFSSLFSSQGPHYHQEESYQLHHQENQGYMQRQVRI